MADLTVAMSQDDWVKTLNVIAEGPFKIVAPIMQNIQRQLQGQMEMVEQQVVKAQQHMPRPNGELIEPAAPGA
jgi:hypothetical protein